MSPSLEVVTLRTSCNRGGVGCMASCQGSHQPIVSRVSPGDFPLGKLSGVCVWLNLSGDNPGADSYRRGDKY